MHLVSYSVIVGLFCSANEIGNHPFFLSNPQAVLTLSWCADRHLGVWVLGVNGSRPNYRYGDLFQQMH